MKVLRLLYFSVFFIPLVYNPFGGANPYEAAKVFWLIFIVSLAILFVIFSFIYRREITLAFNKNIFILILLWALSFVFSTINSIAPVESFWGSFERLQGSFTYIFYLLHFLICLQIFDDKKIREAFLKMTFGIGIIVCALALLQGLEPTIFGERIFGTLGNPTQLGQFIIFPLFVGIAYFLRAVKKKAGEKALFFGVAILLILTAMVIAKSRAAMLETLFSAVLVGSYFLFVNAKKYSRLRMALAVSALIAIIAAACAGIFLMGSSRSLESRLVLWKASAPLLQKHFLLGSGPETIYQTMQTTISPDLYKYERLGDIPDRSHNEILDAFLTRGVLGFSLYALNIIFLIYLFFGKRLKTRPAYIAFSAISGYLLSVQLNFSSTVHIVFLLAMAAVLCREQLKFSRKTVPLDLRSAAICAVAVFFAFSGLVFSARLIAGDNLLSKFLPAYLLNKEGSLVLMKNVTDLLPQYAYPYLMAHHFLVDDAAASPETKGKLAEFVERAGNITRRSFKYHLARARFEQGLGNMDAATQHFEEAVEKAPNWPPSWFWRGESAFKIGDYKTAKQALERYVRFAPALAQTPQEMIPSLTEKEREWYRIFSLSGYQFFEALKMLEAIRFLNRS